MRFATLRRGSCKLAIVLATCWHGSVLPGFADSPGKKQVALVIGNSNYGGGDSDISGIENARAMKTALEDLDFEVMDPVLLDADAEQIQTALNNFSQHIKDATRVVVFYSGHGFQLGGHNFLYPKGGDITDNPTLSVSLEAIRNALATAPATAFEVVFIDACRTSNRFTGSFVEEPTQGNLLVAFAASPGQVADAGGPKARSPYTIALLQHLREPGLKIEEMLLKVRADMMQATGQVPSSFGATGFFLRPPVYVRTAVDRGENDVILSLNGEIVLDRSVNKRTALSLRLHSGDNPLTVLVSSQRTYRNTHSWEKTEGWGYCLRLFGPGGTELKVPRCGGKNPCFSASEDVPFKDGTHHGRVFTVATAVFHVDPVTSEVKLTNIDPNVWDSKAPLAERNQDVLAEVKAKELLAKAIKIPPDDLGRYLSQIPAVVATLAPNLPPLKLPNLDLWVARVHGNSDFRSAVKTCMEDHEAERVTDLQESIGAAFKGVPVPFQLFDDRLSACVQTEYEHQTGKQFGPREVRVWTAFEDLSDTSQPFNCGLGM